MDTFFNQLLLVFAVSTVACAIVSYIGWLLEDKFENTRWEFVTFPFIFLGFGLCLLAVSSGLVIITTLIQGMFG